MTLRLRRGPADRRRALVPLQRPNQLPAFRSGVDVVRLDVSVVRNGVPGPGIDRRRLRRHRQRRSAVVDSIVVDQLPLSVQLVLDTSGSVLGPGSTHLIAAADGFVAALRPGDWAGLLTFSHRLRPLAPITEDLASVRGALAAITGDGQTALRDAVQFALAADHAAGARR